MESIALATDISKSNLLKKVRLKISEWLDFENVRSEIKVTVYLEFSDFKEPMKLEHFFMIVPKSDFKKIISPTKEELEKENKILKNEELSRMMNIKGDYILPIFVKRIKKEDENEDHVLVKIDLKKFELNGIKKSRFQFKFYIENTFKKKSFISNIFDATWDWWYESHTKPLILEKNEFSGISIIKMDLEKWVMIGPKMYNSVSDLNIHSTQPFDRLVILPEDFAESLGRTSKILCFRWFFSEFSESRLGPEIIINKKRSGMDRERKYIEWINENPDQFFSAIERILSDSRIACVDFGYIRDKIHKSDFSNLLDVLFQLLYHRDDQSFERLEELVNILKQYQDLKNGKYYYHMFKLLYNMQSCEKVRDIIAPKIKKRVQEFQKEPWLSSRTNKELFEGLNNLLDLIKQFYYLMGSERKRDKKKEISTKVSELRDIAEKKLINPQSYLLAEEILLKWEHLVEEELERFVGTPELNVEIITKKLLASECVHIIFNITNIRDVPMVNVFARLLPSEEYDIPPEQKRRGTHFRNRLTKSDDQNKRIFSPEFGIILKNFPKIQIKLEVEFYTEEGEKFVKKFEKEIELFHEDIPFKEIDPNPYITGAPVKNSKMFYGREEIFKQIRETTVGDELINQAVVYGQYRIGKTSVLFWLKNVLKGKYIPVLDIVQEFETGDSELLQSWSKRILEEIRDRMSSVPEIPDYEKLSYPYKEFQGFLEEILRRLEGARIVLMIDEYDLLDEYVGNSHIKREIFWLLDWMIKREKVELILAGRLPIEDLRAKEWKKIARPFVEIKLGSLDMESTKNLITRPIAPYLKYDSSAIERIINLTNCHPYLVQLCCHVLVNYHNSKYKPVLNYSDIEENVWDIVDLGSLGLEAMILTDSTLEEQIVLRVMADYLKEQTSISEDELVVAIREYNREIKDEDIKVALENLSNREVIRSVTEEMRRFRFTCELFKYWIYAKMEPL